MAASHVGSQGPPAIRIKSTVKLVIISPITGGGGYRVSDIPHSNFFPSNIPNSEKKTIPHSKLKISNIPIFEHKYPTFQKCWDPNVSHIPNF